MIAIPETLEEIRNDADGETYPQDRLAGAESALVLFSAGFFGRQDAFWIASAGLRAMCIDTDADRLDAMAAVYPTHWDFIEANVYEWAPAAAEMSRHWDVVSVDCPSGHFDRCADLLPLWCSLARRVVVLGCGQNRGSINVPAGWVLSDMRRRSNYDGGVYWAVVEAG